MTKSQIPGQVSTNVNCIGGGLDYQFYVANTGVIGIDGVAFGLGVTPANYGAAINQSKTGPFGQTGPGCSPACRIHYHKT